MPERVGFNACVAEVLHNLHSMAGNVSYLLGKHYQEYTMFFLQTRSWMRNEQRCRQAPNPCNSFDELFSNMLLCHTTRQLLCQIGVSVTVVTFQQLFISDQKIRR